MAIIWSFNHFGPCLYGKKFQIATNHRPLTWVFSVKDPGSKLIRWRLKLEQYEYEIIYKRGRVNSNADCLSRIPARYQHNNWIKSYLTICFIGWRLVFDALRCVSGEPYRTFYRNLCLTNATFCAQNQHIKR